MAHAFSRIVSALFVAGALIAATAADSHALIGARVGMFMPNGDADGLDGWEEGWAGEIFLGGGMGPFGWELGAGTYIAESGGPADASLNVYYLNGTAKGYVPLGPVALYGGGGFGFYYGEFDSDFEDFDLAEGNGIGYHLVAGLEGPIGPVAIFGEARWNFAEIDLGELREDTNVGGVTVSLGLRF